MRTVNFRDEVLFPAAQLLGLDPAQDLWNDQASALVGFCTMRVKEAWRFWDWPELRVTEERAYRTIWRAGRSFLRVGPNGLPDELFYIPTFLYYKVKSGAVSDPPAGTLPTDTAYFEVLTAPDQYIALDQECRQPIGEVLGIYNGNPLSMWSAPMGLNFRPSQRGFEVSWLGGASVFITFKIRPSKFTATPYAAGTTYRPGSLVYWTDGNSYRNLVTSTGVDPTSAATWVVVPFPERFAEFVKLAAASDAAEDLQTSGKLLSQAYDNLKGEVDTLIAQGDVHFYNTASRLRRIFIPQGVSGYWWSVSAPWTGGGASVTTLTDQCYEEGGMVTPPSATAEEFVLPLVIGQDYVDVVFATDKGGTAWKLEGTVENDTDAEVSLLKLWITTITLRTALGCRVWLNAAPDTANYKLRGEVR